MKKDKPFKVPNDYFDKLSDRVQERIEKEEKPAKQGVFQIVKPYLWMAASIIGMALIIKVIITNSVPTDYQNPQISQIEDTSTINNTEAEYDLFFDNMSETTSDEIIDYLTDYDLETDELLANL
nr:hypothetical protein [uncultured Marinifilum sp.]